MRRIYSSRKKLIAISTISFFICLTAWTFSAPISSAPDSDFHMSSIWCAWGVKPGICENPTNTSTGNYVDVPFFVQICDNVPITSSNCEPTNTYPQMQTLRTSDSSAKNFYYVLMRVFAGQNVPLSIITIRLLSCFLATLLLFGLISLVRGRLLIGSICSLVFVLVPNALVLIPMATSKSWALIGSLFGWAFLATSLHQGREFRERTYSSILFGLCFFLVASTRIDATIFLLFSSLLIVYRKIGVRSIFKNSKRVLVSMILISILILAIRFSRVNGYIFSLKLENKGSMLDSFVFYLNQVVESLASCFGYSVPQSGAGPGITGIIGVGLASLVVGSSLQNQRRDQLVQIILVILFLILIVYYGNITMGPRVPGTYILSIASLLIGVCVANAESGPSFLFNTSSRTFIFTLVSINHWMVLRGRTYHYAEFTPQTEIYMPWLQSLISPVAIVTLGSASFVFFLISAFSVLDVDIANNARRSQVN
jgi:hypothetical protein